MGRETVAFHVKEASPIKRVVFDGGDVRRLHNLRVLLQELLPVDKNRLSPLGGFEKRPHVDGDVLATFLCHKFIDISTHFLLKVNLSQCGWDGV